MLKDSVKITLKDVFSKPVSLAIIAFTSAVVMSLYIVAIEMSASIEIFLMANSTLYIALQILFSAINSLLLGISIAIIIEVFRKRKNSSNLSIVDTILALIFSVGTTGCYVCGTLLLPVVGLTTSLAALPFGGLEVKFLTILLIAYSIVQSSKVYAGICDLTTYKIIKLKIGEGFYNLSSKPFVQFRPFIIILIFSLLVFVVPTFFTNGSIINRDVDEHSCPISNK